MGNIEVLKNGVFTPEDFSIQLVQKSNRLIDPQLEKKVKQSWRELLKEAKKN